MSSSVRIGRLRSVIFSALQKCVQECAAECVGIARELAPYDAANTQQPHLRDSFSVESSRSGCIAESRAVVKNPHAAYVEFGTGQRGSRTGAGSGYDPDWPGMAAQPYLQPAADCLRARFPAEAAALLRSEMRKNT